MLSRIITYSLKFNINSVLNNKRALYSFGSSGHDDHHHDDVDEGLVVDFIEEAISISISFM